MNIIENPPPLFLTMMIFHNALSPDVDYNNVTCADSAGRLKDLNLGSSTIGGGGLMVSLPQGGISGVCVKSGWPGFPISRDFAPLSREPGPLTVESCPHGPITGLMDWQKGGHHVDDKGLTDRGYNGARLPGKIKQNSAHLLLFYLTDIRSNRLNYRRDAPGVKGIRGNSSGLSGTLKGTWWGGSWGENTIKAVEKHNLRLLSSAAASAVWTKSVRLHERGTVSVQYSQWEATL